MSEAALFGIVGEILGIPEVDPAKGFVALGGDSIAAINVVRRLQRTTGIELDALDLLSCDSLGELSESMTESVEAGRPAAPTPYERG